MLVVVKQAVENKAHVKGSVFQYFQIGVGECAVVVKPVLMRCWRGFAAAGEKRKWRVGGRKSAAAGEKQPAGNFSCRREGGNRECEKCKI